MTRVLYIDNGSNLSKMAKSLLETRVDFDVDIARSVTDAIDMLGAREYDAVVCGHVLPDLDGIGFLRTLRGKGDDIPFILYSDKNGEEVAIEALDGGADFYLQKRRDPESQLAELANLINHSVKRKKAEDALQLANKKLNLLGRVTRHDIRNQLTVLSGYLELAKDRTMDERTSRYIESSIRALESIDKILEFGRDYEFTGTMKPEWIDVKEVCQEQMSSLDFGNVRLQIELDHLEILADALLAKVFYNLANNALKHAKNVKNIRFFHRESGDGLILICKDDGFGIKREDKKSIFEGKRGHGLYLVSEILRTNGMSIRETGELGEGARFEIHVPEGKYRFTKSK
jgi:signal transduction histidine kinase